MNISDCQAAIKTHITRVLENRKFFVGDNPRIVCGFSQELIPLLYIAADNQSLVIFIKLIKGVG